jgi:DNA-binding NarL/FixJ family response regulator
MSNKEIASELNLSLRTVEGHISRILDKKSFVAASRRDSE